MSKLLVALLAVVLLSGCTAVTDGEDPEAAAGEASSSPSAHPGPTREPETEDEADAGDEADSPIMPIDGGPRTGAAGVAEFDGDIVASYVVAEGDVAIEISQRFSVELDQLADADGTRLGRYPTLYVGDIIHFVPQLTGQDANCFYRSAYCGPE
ncbi:hypothetical protein FVA74_00770 [Salinibacterium sp. dk2585]|uniref:hypothetical protein n=1 Tax=unclassified Salinibacterium TaxID=2632331 RepID=UPI0011C25286|nr:MULTISPECIES: hypothetical protein [unclassified Salinibacterium]QEE60258.1 hypothetical protein FVA74_00770 [Salinibacterium sp. dk2585]TXK55330.1 hypothetical protein FVP63_00915 [Salinibacterium sp. dk5596]